MKTLLRTILVILSLVALSTLHAATFTVINPNDSGGGLAPAGACGCGVQWAIGY